NNNSNNNSWNNGNSNNNSSNNGNSNSNSWNNNNSNNSSNASNCRGYWDGGGCVTDRRDLIQYLQEALQSTGCNVGRADGVWGTKTTRSVAAANKQFGTYFRKSNNPVQYGKMITDVESTNYNLCDCPSGKVLNSGGNCVPKKAIVKNTGGTSLFRVRNVASNATLNMRSRPTASSAIVDRIAWAGTHVKADEGTCRANSVGWVKVEWGGSHGWVASRYLISMSDGHVACK
ncbi:SH3 domain-containing protein, partial [Alphaproteobacteria bacterium]|nr:SH3 domain-containing protein [Alphaproteobacteria bacterium]